MNPLEALDALQQMLRAQRRNNVARLLAGEDFSQEALQRFISLQIAIEAVQRAERDEADQAPSRPMGE